MTLDSDIDQNTADAKYADGILTPSLPKKAGSASRQLTVK
jgi:HSP20 family molecular chaperone IbpA